MSWLTAWPVARTLRPAAYRDKVIRDDAHRVAFAVRAANQ